MRQAYHLIPIPEFLDYIWIHEIFSTIGKITEKIAADFIDFIKIL